VRVRLPASTITAPAPVAAAAVAPRVGSLSILLVDDNEDLADMLGLALRRLGHRVEVVHDSLEALRVAPGLAVDVAVLDIGLPVLDGFELARRLRQLERARGLRLVAMSGYGQPSDRERAREVGFDAYLVKPVSVEALTGALGAPVARG
jgi:CheY-like chemotaxis protein